MQKIIIVFVMLSICVVLLGSCIGKMLDAVTTATPYMPAITSQEARVQELENKLSQLQIEVETKELELEQAKTANEKIQLEAALTDAKGRLAIAEASAEAVKSQTRLVTWYAIRGDIRGAAILAVVALAVGVYVGYKYAATQPKKHEILDIE